MQYAYFLQVISYGTWDLFPDTYRLAGGNKEHALYMFIANSYLIYLI